jgi:hypothetical protein
VLGAEPCMCCSTATCSLAMIVPCIHQATRLANWPSTPLRSSITSPWPSGADRLRSLRGDAQARHQVRLVDRGHAFGETHRMCEETWKRSEALKWAIRPREVATAVHVAHDQAARCAPRNPPHGPGSAIASAGATKMIGSMPLFLKICRNAGTPCATAQRRGERIASLQPRHA